MGVDVMRIETENVGQNDTDQEFILGLSFPLWFFTRENTSEQNILFYTACWHWKAFALDIIRRRGYNDFVNLLNH